MTSISGVAASQCERQAHEAGKMCHLIKMEMEKQQEESWWWCTELMDDSSQNEPATSAKGQPALLAWEQHNIMKWGGGLYCCMNFCFYWSSKHHQSRQTQQSEWKSRTCMCASGHFPLDFVGPWFLLQLINAFLLWFQPQRTWPFSLSVTWHLKLGKSWWEFCLKRN